VAPFRFRHSEPPGLEHAVWLGEIERALETALGRPHVAKRDA
jgi:hypothetical protein